MPEVYCNHLRLPSKFMIAKVIIVLIFVAIVGSLASGLVYLVKDKGQTDRTVKALTVRIALSVALFALLLVMFSMGWIDPHGIGS